MSIWTVIGAVAVFGFGVWLLGLPSWLARVVAIVPLFGGMVAMLNVFGWSNIPEKLSWALMILCWLIWSVSLLTHDNKGIRVVGLVLLVIGLLVLYATLGTQEKSVVDAVWNGFVKWWNTFITTANTTLRQLR